MMQLVAQPQTGSMSLDGQRTAGHPVFPLKRRQQTPACGGVKTEPVR